MSELSRETQWRLIRLQAEKLRSGRPPSSQDVLAEPAGEPVELLPVRRQEPQTSPGVTSLVRACVAAGLGVLEARPAVGVARREWPTDEGAEWLTRAAVSPADMTGTPQVVSTVVADFVKSLGPMSGAAALMAEGLQLRFDHAGAIAVPTLVADPALSGFVAEGDPIPVVEGDVSLITLQPKKLATIAVLTAEMLRSSNAEALVRDMLMRSTALGLDAALLDASPGDRSRPPGLLWNIAASTASSAPDPTSALFEDILTLQQAIAPTLIDKPLIVLSPARRTTALLYSFHELEQLSKMVVASPALTGTMRMVMLEPSVLVSVMGNAPTITASREGATHMDSAPLPLTGTGSLAAPVRSAWQTDCVAIKVELPVSWGVRSGPTPGVSWLIVQNW